MGQLEVGAVIVHSQDAGAPVRGGSRKWLFQERLFLCGLGFRCGAGKQVLDHPVEAVGARWVGQESRETGDEGRELVAARQGGREWPTRGGVLERQVTDEWF